MRGFRIHIADSDFEGTTAAHYSGIGNVAGAPHVRCPNCQRELFPVFNLSFVAPPLTSLGVWRSAHANVLTCPACALYMEPYFIYHATSPIEVAGGRRDGGKIIQDIDLPYRARLIELTPLSQPVGDVPPHQVGGRPPRGDAVLLKCPSCAQRMKFFGVVAYDDLNVPLYENRGSPVALIIGDLDHLVVFSCTNCAVLGVRWSALRRGA